MKHTLTLLTVLLLAPLVALHAAEKPIPIWPQGAPGALGNTSKDGATITPYMTSTTAATPRTSAEPTSLSNSISAPAITFFTRSIKCVG